MQGRDWNEWETRWREEKGSSAALLGKKVLHLDRQQYYGDAWTGLALEEFVKHITPTPDANGAVGSEESTGSTHWIESEPCLFDNVEIVVKRSEEVLGQSQDYILDVTPKVENCARFWNQQSEGAGE